MRGVTCKFLYILHQFCKFQSTLPGRERRLTVKCSTTSTHFNPHSPCGERLEAIRARYMPEIISIHTPHAGSDSPARVVESPGSYFNPHSPCGERPLVIVIDRLSLEFQSTLPMRGATAGTLDEWAAKVFQSTLPMRGATSRSIRCTVPRLISIHTPHAGSDGMQTVYRNTCKISIHTPHAGSDQRCSVVQWGFRISIHTPHAGSDLGTAYSVQARQDFNPHSPCGERHVHRRCGVGAPTDFNPHSPCGERRHPAPALC